MRTKIVDLEVYREKLRMQTMAKIEKEVEEHLDKYEQVLDLLCELPKPLVIRAMQFSLVYLIKFKDLREKQYYP